VVLPVAEEIRQLVEGKLYRDFPDRFYVEHVRGSRLPDRQNLVFDFFVHPAFLRFVCFPSSCTYITLNGENSKMHVKYTLYSSSKPQ